MADRWIVTERKYREYTTLEIAQDEAARLRAAFPHKPFRVKRVKTSLERSNADVLIPEMMEALEAALLIIDADMCDGHERADGADLRTVLMIRAIIAKVKGTTWDAGDERANAS